MKRLALMVLALGLSGCATYNYAQNMRLVSFDDNAAKGKSVGNIRGEDCTWQVLGYQLGGLPTVDRALMNARKGAGAMESAGFGSGSGGYSQGGLKYINNLSTKTDGFNAGVVGKTCIVVSGVGYL